MPTRASDVRPTRRLVESPLGDAYVLEVYARRLVLRPKGARRGGPAEVEVSPGRVYQRALRERLEAERAEKRATRRGAGRRTGRGSPARR